MVGSPSYRMGTPGHALHLVRQAGQPTFEGTPTSRWVISASEVESCEVDALFPPG